MYRGVLFNRQLKRSNGSTFTILCWKADRLEPLSLKSLIERVVLLSISLLSVPPSFVEVVQSRKSLENNWFPTVDIETATQVKSTEKLPQLLLTPCIIFVKNIRPSWIYRNGLNSRQSRRRPISSVLWRWRQKTIGVFVQKSQIVRNENGTEEEK